MNYEYQNQNLRSFDLFNMTFKIACRTAGGDVPFATVALTWITIRHPSESGVYPQLSELKIAIS
jgi:hypothetical protein